MNTENQNLLATLVAQLGYKIIPTEESTLAQSGMFDDPEGDMPKCVLVSQHPCTNETFGNLEVEVYEDFNGQVRFTFTVENSFISSDDLTVIDYHVSKLEQKLEA